MATCAHAGRLAAIVGLGVGLALGGTALASPEDDAQRAFEEGRALVKAGKIAQGCLRLEDSNRLDPQLGTAYNLAQCYEKLGRLATAQAILEDLLARDDLGPRRVKERELLDSLAPRVPTLTLTIQPGGARARVKLDDVPSPDLLDGPVGIDLGTHRIEIRAEGYERWHGTVEVRQEGEAVTRQVDLVPTDDGTGDGTGDGDGDGARDRDAEPTSPRGHSAASTATLIGGVALLAGAAVLGGLAYGRWSDVHTICPGSECLSTFKLEQANGLRDDALLYAHVADGLAIAGVAAIAIGIVLHERTPASRATVTALHGGGTAGVAVVGRW